MPTQAAPSSWVSLRSSSRDVFAFQSAGGASATSPSEEVVKRTFSFFARRAYVPEPLNGLAIDEAFTRFDRDMSGSLSRGELRLALGQLFVQQSPLMSRRADEAMREFEAGGTRALTLSQFSQLVHALVEQQQQDALMALSTSDLLGALRQLGLEATGEQAAAVLKKYDEDRSGTISLSEFERLAQDLSDYLATQSRPAISSRDLHSALQGMGVRATDAQAAAVMARYDADKSGTLEHPEFEKLVLDLHQHLHGGAAARPATLAPPRRRSGRRGPSGASSSSLPSRRRSLPVCRSRAVLQCVRHLLRLIQTSRESCLAPSSRRRCAIGCLTRCPRRGSCLFGSTRTALDRSP